MKIIIALVFWFLTSGQALFPKPVDKKLSESVSLYFYSP